VTKVYKQPLEKWYPTLGSIRDHVKLEITVGVERGILTGAATPRLVDGMYVNLYSAKEDLVDSRKRCDVLAAFNDRKSLYYEYRECTQENRTWMIFLRTGSGLVKSGSRVRLVNEKFGQFMASKNGYLTTVTEYSTDCDWMLEKA
jgi:hypothetical protein